MSKPHLTQNPNEKIRLSFVLLNYNRADLSHQRLGEYIRFVQKSPIGNHCELVFIDNGSEPSLAPITNKVLNGTVVRLEDNQGFSGGFNAALGNIRGRYAAIWSNDVSIGPGIAEGILQLMDSFEASPLVLAKEIISHPAGWNQFGDTVVSYPAGYFFCVRTKEWEDRGGFDERYKPYDYEDVDVGMWCQREGGQVYAANVLPVQHEGAATIGFTPERREVTNENRRKFAEKWGLDLVPEKL